VSPPPWEKKKVSLPSKVLNTNKRNERAHFNVKAAKQAGGDLDVIDKEERMTVVLRMQVTWTAMLKNAKLKD